MYDTNSLQTKCIYLKSIQRALSVVDSAGYFFSSKLNVYADIHYKMLQDKLYDICLTKKTLLTSLIQQ